MVEKPLSDYPLSFFVLHPDQQIARNALSIVKQLKKLCPDCYANLHKQEPHKQFCATTFDRSQYDT